MSWSIKYTSRLSSSWKCKWREVSVRLLRLRSCKRRQNKEDVKSFIYSPTDALVSCLKNNIKIYIKTAPTCFGVSYIIITECTNSCLLKFSLSLLWRRGPTRAMAASFLRFLDHTRRRITVGRTPLDEWSARRTDLYLTTHNTHNRQTSMPPVGFEPTISAGEQQQTYALARAASGTGAYWS